jgi:hypothetical protein
MVFGPKVIVNMLLHANALYDYNPKISNRFNYVKCVQMALFWGCTLLLHCISRFMHFYCLFIVVFGPKVIVNVLLHANGLYDYSPKISNRFNFVQCVQMS